MRLIVCHDDDPFPASKRELGVALKSISGEQNHVGIIYSWDDEARLCHLAYHYDLRDEPLRNGYFWGSFRLHEHVLSQIAGYVALLNKNKKSIPYGFSYDSSPFDEQGHYQQMAIGKGLTCATFVMAVFERQGYPLLIKDDWPDRETDQEWKKCILESLQGHATQEHIEAAKNDKDAPRFRPEEVVAGAVSENPPVAYSTVESLALAILNALKGEA